MTDSHLPPTLDRELREAHPTSVYEEIDPGALDRHLEGEELKRLLAAVNAVSGARVSASVVEEVWERSHMVHVGASDAPAFHEFVVLGGARVSLIREHGGSIPYWIIHLSRVGPYWTAYWNDWRVKDGRPHIEMRAPGSPEWTSIVERVSSLLAERGWREIGPEVLDLHLPWLSTLSADVLVERGASPHPTVHDALFAEEIC
jgi:hypothetical protein